MRMSFVNQKLSVLLMLLCLCFGLQMMGETTAPFPFDVETTKSNCKADGTLRVKINNYSPNYLNPQYSILQTNPPAGEEAKKVDFQSQDYFTTLPSGRYTVTVRLLEKATSKYVEFKKENVEVGADYTPIDGKFQATTIAYDQTNSRPSYKDCATGKLYVKIEGSRTLNNSNLQIKIRKAGEEESANRTIKFHRSVGSPFFRLANVDASGEEEKHLPGKYIITVDDGCSVTPQEVTLPAITNLPKFKSEGTKDLLFNAGGILRSQCNAPLLRLELDGSFVNSPEFTSFAAEMFEIALAPKGVEPTDDQFTTLTFRKDLTIPPVSNKAEYEKYLRNRNINYYNLPLGKNTDGTDRLISDYYQSLWDGEATLEATVRLKGCPTNSRKFLVGVAPIGVSNSYETVQFPRVYDECGKVGRGIYFSDYRQIYCYPYTVTVTSEDGSEVITKQIPNKDEGKPHFDALAQIKVKIGKAYTYVFTDGNGKQVYRYTFTEKHKETLASPLVEDCGAKYVQPFKVRSMVACYPYVVEVYKPDSTLLGQININNAAEAEAYTNSMPLEFGQSYRFKVMKDGVKWHQFDVKKDFNRNPTIGINLSDVNKYCHRDQGTLNVMFNNEFLEDKTIIVKDKNGREIGRGVTEKDQNTQYTKNKPDVNVEQVIMPPGDYTIEVQLANCSFNYPFHWDGFYNRVDFKYTSKPMCGGMEIYPEGFVTKQGVKSRNDTYFRIIEGPSGGFNTNEVATIGGKLKITGSGDFKLGILPHSVYKQCALDTIDIHVELLGLSTSPPDEAAYACGGSSTLGHIFTKAIGGTPPYAYELWKDDRSAPIMVSGKVVKPKEFVGDNHDIAHFEHGTIGETYSVKIKDACGAETFQNLTIANLANFRFVTAPVKTVCAGDVIYITTNIPLNSYRWYPPGKDAITNPNDYISIKRELIIYNARVEDSGRYECQVIPIGCGTGLRDFVEIVVLPCTAPVNPHLMQRVQYPIAP